VVEDDCALGDPVAPWNLKDRRAALGSNRIGLDLRWSRLASLSCWPGLQPDFETNVINALGRCAVSLESPFGAQSISVSGPSVWTGRALQAESSERKCWSCASVSGPCVEQIAPGHHGYPRAFGLILRSALEGPLGHQIMNATARPFSHSSNPTRRPRRVSPISNVL